MKYLCLNCGVSGELSSNRLGKYCTNSCQREFEQKRRVSSWLSGEEKGYSGKSAQLKPFVRRYLHDTRGTACEECGWDKRHPCDGSVLTEIDHVDGDAMNCTPENLKILCPNCHSMTPTFRARNKKSSRIR
ncbi:HNH endonuclease [Pectobacterium phage vB_PatM_CB7]|nr:HNH endonuclease [Pectobacterium phage vB_PatM_CB7]